MTAVMGMPMWTLVEHVAMVASVTGRHVAGPLLEPPWFPRRGSDPCDETCSSSRTSRVEHVFDMRASVDDASQLLVGLNEEQLAAVTHPGGPLLVLAGAGSGKTTTLSRRVAWLVEQGVAPERVLLLTFTRRAAREMLGRVRSVVGSGSAGIVGGTFHSVAYRLVRSHAAALGLPANAAVLDASDAADLLDLVREELGLAERGKRFPRKGTIADIYSATVNARKPLSQVLADSYPWCEEHLDALAGLFRRYTERKRELGVLDLDDLLLYWHALARHETVGRQLGGLFEQVLVDEYQDLNALQVEIVRALRQDKRGLTAVGDDFQAIYGFRAASAEHILAFPEHFPDATVVTLERNYRSTQPILDLANEVAAGAARAYPKRLHADRDGGGRPLLVFCRDEAQQAVEVCERVLAAHEQATALRQQAVLMRAGQHSDLLELELGRRRIPFVKYGGIRYLETAHVKDFLCLLRLSDNPADGLSWFRILQLLDCVGPVTARRALDALDPPRLGNLAELASNWQHARATLKEPARAAADPLIAALASSAGERTLGRRVELLRDALAPLIRAHYLDGEVRLRDLEQLVATAAQARDLASFLAELALDPPSSSADYAGPPMLEEDYLVLSTVHSAKGLEWQVVHLIAASDGNFPSDMALSTPEGLEEERRLFYVALTRARQTLAVYVPNRYYHRPGGRDDTHGYGTPSRFLTDTAQTLCELVPQADGLVTATITATDTTPIRVSLDDLWQ
jgi:DNA helicase-2/ATP-dependent DNA helicase PcrA